MFLRSRNHEIVTLAFYFSILREYAYFRGSWLKSHICHSILCLPILKGIKISFVKLHALSRLTSTFKTMIWNPCDILKYIKSQGLKNDWQSASIMNFALYSRLVEPNPQQKADHLFCVWQWFLTFQQIGFHFIEWIFFHDSIFENCAKSFARSNKDGNSIYKKHHSS